MAAHISNLILSSYRWKERGFFMGIFSMCMWGIVRIINSRAITRLDKERVKRANPIRAIQKPYSSGFLIDLYSDFLTMGIFSSKKFSPNDRLMPNNLNPHTAITRPETNKTNPVYFKIWLS